MWLKVLFVVNSGVMCCYVVEIGLMWLKVVYVVNKWFYVVENPLLFVPQHVF